MLKDLTTNIRRTKNDCFVIQMAGYAEDGKYTSEDWSFTTLIDAFNFIEGKI